MQNMAGAAVNASIKRAVNLVQECIQKIILNSCGLRQHPFSYLEQTFLACSWIAVSKCDESLSIPH